MPQYFDIHTHMNFSVFKDRYHDLIEDSLKQSVWMNNVGTTYETSARAVKIAEEFDEGVYATIGLHPIHTSQGDRFDEDSGKTLKTKDREFSVEDFRSLASSEKVVAIGECGLDYFHVTDEDEKKKEREQFALQIDLANELGKPLMLHIRNGDGGNAYQDAIEILEESTTVPGNAHFFSGTVDDARKLLSLGFSLSFTGVVTLTKDYDELIKFPPLDMIMAETDAPYVAPKSIRGKENLPIYVKEVADKIAQVREEDSEEVRQALVDNAKRFFNIN